MMQSVRLERDLASDNQWNGNVRQDASRGSPVAVLTLPKAVSTPPKQP
jgi:hypothetical protein